MELANSNMFIIKYRKFFVALSGLLVLASVVIVAVRGLDYGTEFTGGSVLEVSYTQNQPSIEDLRMSVSELDLEVLVQPFGESGYIIKTNDVTEAQRQALITASENSDGEVVVERFNSIGPSVGRELRSKSLYALIAVSLGIVLFVAYAFRKVAQPVASWKYGVIAVIALLHDILIPVGILTLLGTEVDTLYVVGLLSILGLSVNDTIVVFDRVRENLLNNDNTSARESFPETVGNAINGTLIRSLFTSLTLFVVLIALYIYGPVATRTLALVLLLGTLVGTYSSIFLASPLLTYFVGKNEK